MKETGSYLLDVLFMGGLITASLCDFKKRKIPDAITGFLFLTGVAALFWMPQPSIRMRLAGAFIAGLPLFAAAVCRPGAVGGGDVKLMAAGGFFLGLSAVWDSLAFGMALAEMYAEDGAHASPAGSDLAASCIWETIRADLVTCKS